MKKLLLTLIFLLLITNSFGQLRNSFLDSIRIQYKIPELAYAVVSSDSVYELQALGFKRIDSNLKVNVNDKFRIGSNTKLITSYISFLLVKQGKIHLDTKFFDLYPELKSTSNSAYYDLTLQDLLTFRAKLIKWSYNNKKPSKKHITGNDQQQRYAFVSWFLQQKPVAEQETVYWSNPSYVAAGLMLEKATGKTYETLVAELGKDLGIDFGFGQANFVDINQTWGHDANLKPEKPSLNYKLNWLSSAGNIHVSLPDYSKFIQMQLQGLKGESKIFTSKEFEFMHYGLPEFAFGWNWYVDDSSKLQYSFHEGNPGTFLSKTYICKDRDRAFILFANVQSDEAEEGLQIVLKELKKQYKS